MPWIRKVEIIVSRKDDPEQRTIISANRIDFEVRSTVGWPADTANITIFNLSLDEVKFLQNKDFGDLYIEIRAGYQEDNRVGSRGGMQEHDRPEGSEIRIGIETILPTIFSGMITNAVGYRRSPEHVTQLFCISKAYGASTDFTQMRSLPPGTTLDNAIRSMCEDYGFGTISTFGVQQELLKETLPNGRTFHDSFLPEFRQLLGEYNLLFSVTTGEIQIFPDTYGDLDAVDRMSKDREAVKLDIDSVIGNPVAGIKTFVLSTFLNPSIQPGMILDVSPLLGKKLLVNGVTSVTGTGIVLNTDQAIYRWAMENKYFIMEVVHRGSTHQVEYVSKISAVIGGSTTMGDKETNWQEMYAASGMAMESF